MNDLFVMLSSKGFKLLHTVRDFRATAYQYYGRRWSSMLKFVYYSLFSSNIFIVFGTNLDKDLPVHKLDEGFLIITPTQKELDDLRTGLRLPREFYYDKIHGVKRCYLVTYNGEIAYIHWVYNVGDPSRFLRLREGVAELNYNTTMPKFRGRGLMGKMMAIISSDLKREGYKRVVGVIHSKNPPALKGARKAGWSEITRIRTFGPFNRKIEV